MSRKTPGLFSWDKSNAFSFVRTSAWMWPRCCAPAVRARDVWQRLAPDERLWAQPIGCGHNNTRFAMGLSHSVHIPMNINLTMVGGSLLASTRLGPLGDGISSAPRWTTEQAALQIDDGSPSDAEATT